MTFQIYDILAFVHIGSWSATKVVLTRLHHILVNSMQKSKNKKQKKKLVTEDR